MKYLTELTAYILAKKVVRPEQLEAWIDAATTQDLFKETEAGIILSYVKYTAIIQLERYNGAANWLLALVTTWVMDNCQPLRDQLIERPEISLNIDPLGDGLFDIDISIDFVEPLFIKEDQQGDFSLYGKTYGLGNSPAAVANEAEMIGDISPLQPTKAVKVRW